MTDVMIDASAMHPIFRQPFSITIAPGAITAGAEEHCMEINYTGTLASGSGSVALNIVNTTAGTAGMWAAGMFCQVKQLTTQHVTGYLTAAEFETNLTGTIANISDHAVLTLNAADSHTGDQSQAAYVFVRDYGSKTVNNLFRFWDASIANDGVTTALLSANNPTAATHCIRFLIGTTPYWIMCVNQSGLTA